MEATTRQPLAATLEKLRKNIRQIRSRKETVGEESTKVALINPLLRALGWDLEDLDEVCLEFKSKPQYNPVDYALFILRSPRLFIEAKSLDTKLDDPKWIIQTLSYATVVGVEWCVLTNGDEYRIYNSHAPVGVEQKLFRVVHVSDPTEHEYTIDTLDLLAKDKLGENLIKALWKAQFIDYHVGTALDRLFREEDKGLLNLIRKRTPELKTSEIRESLKRAKIQVDFPIASFPPIPEKRVTPETPENYFGNIDSYKAKVIRTTILERRKLWEAFIEKKRMNHDDFRKYYSFKDKAIAGFSRFLTKNGIASRSGNLFTIDDAVIPEIRKLLFQEDEFGSSRFSDEEAVRYFRSSDPYTQKRIEENILNRRELWEFFLETKRMKAEEFKSHTYFKPKAVAGFMNFLTNNQIAKMYGDILVLNEAVVPEIQRLLSARGQ